jgi:hypothetical protein
MTQVSFIDLAGLVDDAGFNAGTDQQEGIAIVCAESGRNPDAVHHNLGADGVTVLSTDRGLWQINDKAHPEVTDAMAFDAVLATKEAARISSKGSNFVPWSTWGNGAYKAHLEAAAVALAGLALRRKLSTAQAALTATAASLAAAHADLATAQAEVISDEALIATQRSDLAACQSALSAANTANAALQAKIAKARADLT